MRTLGLSILVAAAAGTGCGSELPLEPPPFELAGSDKADDTRTGTLESFESAGAAAAWTHAAWAPASVDAAGRPLMVRRAAFGTTDGAAALQVPVRFTGSGYSQAYVGRLTSASLASAARLVVDVTLPSGAPKGLSGKLILILGSDARWSEPMGTPLIPGATTRVELPLAAAFDPVPDRKAYADVRGYGVKIDGTGVSFTGELAIDRIRLEGVAPPSAVDSGAYPVGVFGGFSRPSGSDIPTRNGFLTYVADASAGRHALVWPKLGSGGSDRVLGEARFADRPAAGTLEFLNWTTVRARARLGALGSDAVTATMSRAFPAVRYETDGMRFEWAGGATWLAVVLDGKPTVFDVSAGTVDLKRMSEPWIVLFGDDAPILLTFERRPATAQKSSGAVRFDFAMRAGVISAMPLFGLVRADASTIATWKGGLPADPLNRARVLTPLLAGFPIDCQESYSLDEAAGKVIVTDRYTYLDVADAWGTKPLHAAPVPPVVLRAGQMGYPVSYPAGTPVDTGVATFYGPFAYVAGGLVQYTLPLPAALMRLPAAVRVDGDASLDRVRSELLALIRNDTPAEPATAFLDNDDRAAAFLAAALPVLDATSVEAQKAASFATRAVEHGFIASSLQELVEPVTGQRYLNSAKYWASAEPFDKEWYTGRQLAALAEVAESVNLDVARGLWPKALGLYRYDRIFFDWALGSVLSSVFGFTALCDGIHFAWEGMLGTARLARLLGDTETYRDAAYRAARQQTALFAAWHHAAWVKQIDYGIGHISSGKLAAADIETRVAVDGFVEDFGSATLELKSFWQTTNYMFFDNVPQLSFYRDFGLEERVRLLEYDIMPLLHPSWTDGSVMDPIDGKYYGTEYTAAHLLTRALLFHDSRFDVYQASSGAEGSKQWYTMRRFGIAGPTLLALARGAAPLVEIPRSAAQLVAARWDSRTGSLALDLLGRRTGAAAVRTRQKGGSFRTTSVSLQAGRPTHLVIAKP